MKLEELVQFAINKKNFLSIHDYIDFYYKYLCFIKDGFQAEIISQNENHYCFYQYKKDGNYNITRPINSNLMYKAEEFLVNSSKALEALHQLREEQNANEDFRIHLIRTIYTILQSIGATLDALPSGKSNQARKVNGDLFEMLIRLLITYLKVDCVSGTFQVKVKDDNGVVLFPTSYQHDLLMRKEGKLKVIGSVKTSSKDPR
ncbi:MAG TPA: hypothetical protein VHE99_02200 [Gammaproteobacteria bacterium]|nr:hypothetical protein [Gammaproteobacteria bacterium]